MDVLTHVALDCEDSDGGLRGHDRNDTATATRHTVQVVSVTIRERRPADLPALVTLLGAQQAATSYPQRWPLPYPAEEFIVRPGELAAWVAVERDVVVGHVSITELAGGRMAIEWAQATGRSADGLAEVSVLFVAGGRGGSGIGGALLDTALAEIRHRGLTPMLDVVGEGTSAGQFYRRRGWRTVGTARPAWLPDHRPDLAFMLLTDERVEL
ncbi:MAG: GNAT family N-acetyltransferase [Knoellia sp.]